MGFEWASGIEHLSYGMVDLPSGKMKSREGTVVDADDLMEEMKRTAAEISNESGKIDSFSESEKDQLHFSIGMAALKYYILKVDPKKRMLFDPKESIDFNGNTGPFIQYAYARIQSILSKLNLSQTDLNVDAESLLEEDLALIKILHTLPQMIDEAATLKSPAIVANYCYELVKTFNHFYQNTPPIIKEENQNIKAFRFHLIQVVGDVIKRTCSLLGINVPNRM